MKKSFNKPLSETEAALQNMLGANNEFKPPRSRVEAILQNMLGADNELEPPQSQMEVLLLEVLENVKTPYALTSLCVTDNGTYTAPDGIAYKQVIVDIPQKSGE